MNPYETLGVEVNATEDEIKAAYKKMARIYHPDISKDNGERFQEIKDAYDVLMDREQRGAYDQYGFMPNSEEGKINIMALQNLEGMMDGALNLVNADKFESFDLIGHFQKSISEKMDEFSENIGNLKEERKGLQKMKKVLKKRLKKKGKSQDVFNLVVDKKINAITQNLHNQEQLMKIGDRMKKILNDFEFEFDGDGNIVSTAQPQYHAVRFISSGTGGTTSSTFGG